jgi:hypothetical protein
MSSTTLDAAEDRWLWFELVFDGLRVIGRDCCDRADVVRCIAEADVPGNVLNGGSCTRDPEPLAETDLGELSP